MKKLIYLMILFSFLTITIASANTLYYENFFDNETTGTSPTGWDANIEVFDIPSGTNKSIGRNTGSTGGFNYALNQTTFRLEANVRRPVGGEIQFMAATTDATKSAAIYIDPSDNIYCTAAGADTGFNWPGDGSTFIETNLTVYWNETSGLYDIFDAWVNGTQVCNKHATRGTNPGFQYAFFMANSEFKVDFVKIWNQNETGPAPTGFFEVTANDNATQTPLTDFNVTLTSTRLSWEPISYWSFDNLTNVMNDLTDRNDGVASGTNNGTGYLNNGILFDGVDDEIEVTDSASLDINETITLSAFVNISGFKDQMFIDKEGAYRLWFDDFGGAPFANAVFEVWNGSAWEQELETLNWNLGQYYHIAAVYNGTHQYIIRDGVIQGTPREDVGAISQSANNLFLGNFEFNGFSLNGTMDEVSIYNYSLSVGEVQELGNLFFEYDFTTTNGTVTTNQTRGLWNVTVASEGYFDETYAFQDMLFDLDANLTAANLTITLFNVTNNTQFNTNNLNIYFSGSTNLANVTCNLNDFGTLAQTVNLSVTSGSFEHTFIETYASSAQHIYNLECQSGAQTDATDNRTIYIDLVNPTINTTFQNLQFTFGRNINGSFNFTDDFLLYSYEIFIDGVLFDNRSELNTTLYQYNLSINPENLTAGSHTLTVNVSDGHTAQYIPKWKNRRNILTNSITYEFDDDWVKIVPDKFNPFDSLNHEKKLDRYSWKHKRIGNGNKEKYIITSSQPITYINNDLYDGWLIVGNLKKWIDFENDNNADVSVDIISDYEVHVTLNNLKDKEVNINSIGTLNTETAEYQFFVGNVTTIIEDPVLEATTTNLFASFAYNATFISGIDSNVSWNGTVFEFDSKVVGTDSINFTTQINVPKVTQNTTVEVFWNYTITGVVSDPETNTTPVQNQTIRDVALESCQYDDPRAALTIVPTNEITILPENFTEVDMAVDLSQNGGDRLNISFEFRDQLNYSICLDPLNSTWNIDAFMSYEKSGFSQRNYFLYETTIGDNQTQILPIYLINDSIDTDVSIEVTDLEDDPVENAFIKILRYYPGNNTHRTVEIARTDNNGDTVSRLILNDVFYKFVIQRNNETLFVSSSDEGDKVLTNQLFFQIQTETSFVETLQAVGNVDQSLTYNETTGIINFIWSDLSNTAQQGCLYVAQKKAVGDIIITDGCTVSSAGTLTSTIDPNASNVYVTRAYFKDADGDLFTAAEFEINNRNDSERFGIEGLLVAIFIITVSTGLGLWRPSVSIVFTILGLSVAGAMGIIGITYAGIISMISIGIFFITLMRE